MAFADLVAGIPLPEGASDRYRTLDGFERQLQGTIYDHLRYSWEQEKTRDGEHIPTRDRRPSTDFNIAHEIANDTLGDLFGDEQFPIVRSIIGGEKNEDSAKAVSDLIEAVELAQVVTSAYWDGVVGSCAVVVCRSDDGSPFYKILPGKWCEPVYRSDVSKQLVALVVTYPIDRAWVEENFPQVTEQDRVAQDFWYRYVIGPYVELDYLPLTSAQFAKLGQKEANGDIITFVENKQVPHGFDGRTPVSFVKNLGGRVREIDGPALWWPARNMMITLDYTLSQIDRGLRYSADPMLFIKQGDLFDHNETIGYEKPAGGMATNVASDGSMVKGVTQTLVGGPNSDAKLLEIGAAGIQQEREFAKDLRELALEIVGGQKSSAQHTKGQQSGTALQRLGKPLRRVVRRQRAPYGDGLLLDLIDLTLYGLRTGVLTLPPDREVNIGAIPENARNILEWPNDEEMVGAELLAHVTANQLAAGGSAINPLELLKPESIASKLASDMGFHQQFDAIKGDLAPLTDPEQPAKIAAMKPPSVPKTGDNDNDK